MAPWSMARTDRGRLIFSVTGQGIIMLLEGSPGVGKTLTAEARKVPSLLVTDFLANLPARQWLTGFESLCTP